MPSIQFRISNLIGEKMTRDMGIAFDQPIKQTITSETIFRCHNTTYNDA